MAITITKEDILGARTYIPIGIKIRLAEQLAQWCVEQMEPEKDDYTDIPPLYVENRGLKQLFMMGIFARFYLNRDFETADISIVDNGKKVGKQSIDYYMSEDSYNEWAGSHVFNQIERLKRDREVSDIIYDIMYDYRAFDTMVYGAMKDRLERRNDVVGRLSSIADLNASPDAFMSTLEKLPELTEKLKEMKEKVESNE